MVMTFATPVTYRAPTPEEAGATRQCANPACPHPWDPDKLVVVEITEAIREIPVDDVNDRLEERGLPRGVKAAYATRIHILGLCEHCANEYAPPETVH
jgi:hypothetical protein